MDRKRPLSENVLDAAKARIRLVFDAFPRVCVSFSGGKDSTVMLHLTAEVARERGRTFEVLFIDLEAQYNATIAFVESMRELYRDVAEFRWVCLPLSLRNAVSVFEPQWVCWDPARERDWVRRPPAGAITDPAALPFFKHAMEFEDFVDEFGRWLADKTNAATLVGIRSQESLNRWRTLVIRKTRFRGLPWSTWKEGGSFNFYPIYDWATEDVWTFHGKTGLPYNTLYDRMHQAGLTIHQMRICQPYGDDQRRGLWLYHVIEPETWGRVVARVNGANSGALYCREIGNIQGRQSVTLPPGHTWKSFATLLLETMPPHTREHYQIKIGQFLDWYATRGYPRGIPDEADPAEEAAKKTPSWRRVCKTLLRNDYWCKGLSFAPHKSGAYEAYLRAKKITKKGGGSWIERTGKTA